MSHLNSDLKGWDENSWRENLNELNAEGCGMSDHTLTYNPNPDGSAPITRCSCGWIAKSGDDVHLISPHAVGMIADQRDLLIAKVAQIAALEAEVQRLKGILGPYGCLPPHDPSDLAPFVALARAAQVLWTIYESLAGDPDPRFACWRNLRDALAHPALKKALGP